MFNDEKTNAFFDGLKKIGSKEPWRLSWKLLDKQRKLRILVNSIIDSLDVETDSIVLYFIDGKKTVREHDLAWNEEKQDWHGEKPVGKKEEKEET